MAAYNIIIENLRTWESLRTTIDKFYYWNEYIFRGQAQEDWLLESTLTRALKKINFEDKEALVKRHLSRFKLEIRGRRGDNPRGLNENELWTLGQHFGLMTPLLDWTESPWVALFFAFANNEKLKNKNSAMWAFHTPDIERINIANNEVNIELIEPIIDENGRLVNQRGLFTKIDIDNDIFSIVKNTPEYGNWATLYKFVFPNNLKDKALLYLNLMNINYSSLFPDIYGSSKNTNSKLLQTDFINELVQKEWDGESI